MLSFTLLAPSSSRSFYYNSVSGERTDFSSLESWIFWPHQPALYHTQVMPSSTHRVWPQQWCKQNRLAHLCHLCTAKVTKKVSRQILYCPLPLIMLEFDPCQYYKISIFFTQAQSPPHLITNGTHLRCIGLAPQVRLQSNACLRTRARVYYTRQTSGSGTARQMISPDARTNFSDAPTNQLWPDGTRSLDWMVCFGPRRSLFINVGQIRHLGGGQTGTT